MTNEQRLRNLNPPTGPVDVILDTDVSCEIDDQFAIAYLLRNTEKLHIQGLCAAPFSFDGHPAPGAEQSYRTLREMLILAGRADLLDKTHRGSRTYLKDEHTPVESDAAAFMADTAMRYSPEHPVYVIAIGCGTNVASALLKNPAMRENAVVVWLCGHAHTWPDTNEFNMEQDVAAARVIFDCGVPLVQVPCFGVVDRFTTTRYELEHWLKGKNTLCDYLTDNTIRAAESYAAGTAWSRPIWDVTAVAWLLNEEDAFMKGNLRPTPIPEYDHRYAFDQTRPLYRYIYHIRRDALYTDLFRKLANHA